MNIKDKEIIAVFDFDGTITTKDTLFDFIKFYFGLIKLIKGLFMLSPILFLYKIKIIKNSRAKQILFSYFFKNESIDTFDSKCSLYSKRIETICRPETLEKIHWHKKQNHRILIVSASIKNWIEPWAKNIGFSDVISTEISIINAKLTGEFNTKNCYGIEKVNRLLQVFPQRNNYVFYAYGDSIGDKELLEFAEYPTLLNNKI